MAAYREALMYHLHVHHVDTDDEALLMDLGISLPTYHGHQERADHDAFDHLNLDTDFKDVGF